MVPGPERNDTMCWDDIYKALVAELGREPDSGEVQQRILEIVSEPMICEQIAPSQPMTIAATAIPLKKGA